MLAYTHVQTHALIYSHPSHTHTHTHTHSAGVGRTGTFTAIDIALQQAEGEGNVDIPSILTKLRNQRMKMVQTLVGAYIACLLFLFMGDFDC